MFTYYTIINISGGKMTKDRLNIGIDREFMKKLNQLTKEENRSRSNMIEQLIQHYHDAIHGKYKHQP